MHGFLRSNINAGVHAHARSGRVTQRCHNSPRWETELASANDVTHRKRAKDLGRFFKKSVTRVETCLGRRRLTFACSRRPWAGVARDWGGADEKARIERLCLTPCVEEPLNSKVIKSFVPEQRSRKCFSCFEIPMFYDIYIYEHYISISHIAISRLRYNFTEHLSTVSTSKRFQH